MKGRKGNHFLKFCLHWTFYGKHSFLSLASKSHEPEKMEEGRTAASCCCLQPLSDWTLASASSVWTEDILHLRFVLNYEGCC